MRIVLTKQKYSSTITTMIEKTHQTIKVWTKTLKRLRHIHAETGEPMVKILDRLVQQEYLRTQQEATHECTN